MQVTQDKKLDKKVQRLLTSCVSKTKRHYNVTGIKAEKDLLIATDGRQLVTIKVKHNLCPDIFYATKRVHVLDEIQEGRFPNTKAVLDDCEGSSKRFVNHKVENLGPFLMRYCVDHGLYCNLVGYYRTIKALEDFSFAYVEGVNITFVDPKKHPMGMIHLNFGNEDIIINYILVTLPKLKS